MFNFLNSLKTKFLLYVLESKIEEKIKKSPKIEIVRLRDSIPELELVKANLVRNVNTTIKDLEIFCTLVQTLNEGLEDIRLNSSQGTLCILRELRDYNALTNKPNIPIMNYTMEGSSGIPKVFFDV